MPIEFRCPHCQRLLRVPDGSQGKQAQCPQCQAMVQVPGPATGGATPAPPPPADNPFSAGASGNPFTTNFPPGSAGAETGNPYQAPTASMSGSQAYAGADIYPIVPARMDLGDVLNRSWAIYKSQLGMLVLIVFASFAIQTGANMVGSFIVQGAAVAINDQIVQILIQVVVQIAMSLFQMWLNLGQLIFMIKVARGRPAEFTDLFTGGPYLVRVILASLVVGLLTTAIALPTLGPAGLVYLATQDQDTSAIVLMIGFAVLLPILIYISLSVINFQALIVDRDMGVMDSLTTSNQVMSGNRLTMFVLWIVFVLVNVLGLLACCVGLVFSLSYTMITGAVAYLVITSQPTADQLLLGAPPPSAPPQTV